MYLEWGLNTRAYSRRLSDFSNHLARATNWLLWHKRRDFITSLWKHNFVNKIGTGLPGSMYVDTGKPVLQNNMNLVSSIAEYMYITCWYYENTSCIHMQTPWLKYVVSWVCSWWKNAAKVNSGFKKDWFGSDKFWLKLIKAGNYHCNACKYCR